MTPVIFINCHGFPFIDDIMSGLKQYETRNRNTLGRFLGERVLLAETGHGAPLVRCMATIDQITEVFTREKWEEYLEATWIPVGSSYDWQPDTKKKVLYHLSDVRPVEPFQLCNGVRHGRIWMELPDLTDVSYWNTGGGVMCYSARYKGMYWIFGNEDCMGAYTVDPMNTTDEHGDLIDPNGYEILNATEFPTWREVIESIPESIVEFYWKDRAALRNATIEWQGSLDKPVNIM